MNIVVIGAGGVGVFYGVLFHKLGHNVKIEQQGAMGIVNELKSQDIENAEVVIIAADKVIDGEDRFKNKTVVKVNIGHCVAEINKGDILGAFIIRKERTNVKKS